MSRLTVPSRIASNSITIGTGFAVPTGAVSAPAFSG